jgi:hypothetical protein
LLIKSQEEVRSDRSQIEEVRSDQIDYPGWLFVWNGANGHQESIERKQPAALNLRSHSLDKPRQIITTGARLYPDEAPIID